jgi:hypothetical protein
VGAKGEKVMSTKKAKRGKKYFTPAEANSTLPLVRVIVKDITDLAADLRDRHERLAALGGSDRGIVGESYREELETVQADLEDAQARMQDYVRELNALGVELKDFYSGLIDFPSRKDGREVYLCWRLGEASVAHWHEVDSGFAGRQKIKAEVVSN